MIYKIYLPDETKKKLLFAGKIETEDESDDSLIKAVSEFIKEDFNDDDEIIISDQGDEGLSIWRGDEVYGLLRKF